MSDFIWKGSGAANPDMVSSLSKNINETALDKKAVLDKNVVEISSQRELGEVANSVAKLSENQTQIFGTPTDSVVDTFKMNPEEFLGDINISGPTQEEFNLAYGDGEFIKTSAEIQPTSDAVTDIVEDTAAYTPKEAKMISAKEALEIDNLDELYKTIPEDMKKYLEGRTQGILPRDSEGFKIFSVERSMGPTEFSKYLDGSSNFYNQYTNYINSSDATFSRVAKGMFSNPEDLGAKPYKNLFSAVKEGGIGGAVKQIGGQSLTGLTRGAYTGVGGEMSAVGVAGTTASKVGTAISLLSRNDYTPETYNPYAQSVAQANLATGESFTAQPTIALSEMDSSLIDSADPMGIMKSIYDKAGVNHGYGYYALNTGLS